MADPTNLTSYGRGTAPGAGDQYWHQQATSVLYVNKEPAHAKGGNYIHRVDRQRYAIHQAGYRPIAQASDLREDLTGTALPITRDIAALAHVAGNNELNSS